MHYVMTGGWCSATTGSSTFTCRGLPHRPLGNWLSWLACLSSGLSSCRCLHGTSRTLALGRLTDDFLRCFVYGLAVEGVGGLGLSVDWPLDLDVARTLLLAENLIEIDVPWDREASVHSRGTLGLELTVIVLL